MTAGNANGAFAVYNNGTIGDIDGSLICGATGHSRLRYLPHDHQPRQCHRGAPAERRNPWTLSNDYRRADVKSGVDYNRGTMTGEMAAGGSIGPVSIVIGGGGIRIF